MKNRELDESAAILRFLPSVDALLRTPTAQKLASEIGAPHLTALAREATDALRRELQKNIAAATDFSRETLLNEAEIRLAQLRKSERNRKLQRVINATGVIVHTNLGRAPLAENARRAIFEDASRYCNLEYDLETGKRGRRGAAAENLLAEITGAESALVVNNCAAAAFFALTVFARGGEVIISRGELVEIGGDFRVPDVLEQSGAILKEVGTTNRTRIADYEKAISENTKAILRVHPSNYRIVGFTAMPELKELVEAAHRNNLILLEDAGSGAIFDLSAHGLADEPVISQSIAAGADVVMFSGDKLLGGVQCGLLVGKKRFIEKLRRHPLYRALRVDKLIYAALEATLEIFHREAALREIPVLKMLALTKDEIKTRTANFALALRARIGKDSRLEFESVEGKSVIGGGSAPTAQPATILLALRHADYSAVDLEKTLRAAAPPVIARILADKVVLDLRTVDDAQEMELISVLADLAT